MLCDDVHFATVSRHGSCRVGKVGKSCALKSSCSERTEDIWEPNGETSGIYSITDKVSGCSYAGSDEDSTEHLITVCVFAMIARKLCWGMVLGPMDVRSVIRVLRSRKISDSLLPWCQKEYGTVSADCEGVSFKETAYLF